MFVLHKLLYDIIENLQIKLYEYNETYVQFLVYSIYIETQEIILFLKMWKYKTNGNNKKPKMEALKVMN